MKHSTFGAKSVTRFDRLSNEEGLPTFEERVVILKAKDQRQAIELAEAEAIAYADLNKGVYLKWVAVYEAKESSVDFEGVHEVYSIMRHDDSKDEDYLDYYYDTGSENTTNYEQT